RPVGAIQRGRTAATGSPGQAGRGRDQQDPPRLRAPESEPVRLLDGEGDREAAEALERGLTAAGHAGVRAEAGEVGLAPARDGGCAVVIVDRMMPRMDGVTLVQTLRREGDQTPVLFLSALGEIHGRVDGLQAGGDDYLVKPYGFAELSARVEALARR